MNPYNDIWLMIMTAINDKQIITQNDIKMWIKKVNQSSRCGTPVYDKWDKNIWKKSDDEIIEYLMKCFGNTNLEVEYYFCLLYLEKHLPNKLKYLPWKESIQYAKAIGIYEKSSLFQDKVKVVKTQNTFKMR